MLGENIQGTLLALGLGIPLVILGFYALDAITPGKLGDLIMGEPVDYSGDVDASGDPFLTPGRDPSMNAALLAAVNVIGSALIVFTAIWTNFNGRGFGTTALWVIVFSLVGLTARVGALKLVDVVTPGHLTDTVCSRPNIHPAAVFAAAADLAMTLIVVAAIA